MVDSKIYIFDGNMFRFIYALICLCFQVLPLENEMKNPEDFGWVLNLGMGIITAMFVSIAVLGYICFGHDVSGSVILNLPESM